VDDRFLEVGRKRHAGTVAADALHGIRGHEVEADVLRLGGRLLAAREHHQLADQRRQLLELLDDVGEKPLPLARRKFLLARQHLDVRSQARERRAQLVGSVQHELTLRARRFLQGGKHRVEARGQTAELVAAGRVDALREIARLADALSRFGQTTHGRKRRAGHHETERGRPPDPTEADDQEERPDLLERIVHLGQRTRHLERERKVGDGDVAHVRSLDGRVVEELVPLAPRDLEHLLGDRE
jgi:hypothetical protein